MSSVENNGRVINCNVGQYLVTVDKVNTCDTSGRFTKVGVLPIQGELQIALKTGNNLSAEVVFR